MSKAQRNRAESARARIAAQQAAARKAEQRRRIFLAGGGVLVVLIVVVVLIIVKANQAPAKAPPPKSDAAIASELATIPASTYDAVGAGPSGSNAVAPLSPISAPPLTSGGKPQVFYLGAEYCPFCAAERWAMVTALSRFGTFTGLHFIHSTSQDIYSNTATLSFYRSTYASSYLVFTPVESATVTDEPLQSPTAAQAALISKYDAVPYVPKSAAGKIPFIDFGGAYVDSGAQYVPSVLGTTPVEDPSHFGLTWAQIAQDLRNPSSPVAQAVLGAANRITAAVCKLTHGQPGNVCQSAAVTSVSSNI
ncbi:MAG TPA: DUF929 family protein [Streptosporangiaceae bacterium]|nr:DUF929 family protein [Streptosporangiaceae bacterium]